jgi:hypothetical protein
LFGKGQHDCLDQAATMAEVLEIFAQYGDPESTDAIRPFHRELSRLFETNLKRKYFNSLEKISIFLRVCGSFWKFEGEGPDRLRIYRKHHAISVDLVIPECRWRGRTSVEVQNYIAEQVRCCFDALLKRAKREKEILDERSLMADFERAMREFKTTVIATGAADDSHRKAVELARAALRSRHSH